MKETIININAALKSKALDEFQREMLIAAKDAIECRPTHFCLITVSHSNIGAVPSAVYNINEDDGDSLTQYIGALQIELHRALEIKMAIEETHGAIGSESEYDN